MRSTSALWGLTALLAPALAISVAEEGRPAYRMEEKVVLAERDVLFAPHAESPALEFVTDRLTEEDLERIIPATASDALALAPGIHTETRGRKFKQFHSFRGQVYPYPDVLVDGIWQRDAREVFYVFPGAMLEEIEIIRSPATLFKGLADVVGVINLVPRQALPGEEEDSRIFSGLEGGTHGTVRGYGYYRRQDEDTAFYGGGQYYRTDGPSGRNAREELTSVFGSYGQQFGSAHRLQANAWLLYGYRQLQQPDPRGPASNSLKNRAEEYDPLTYSHVNFRGYHNWSERTATDWSLFYSDRRARYRREKLDPDGPGPGNITADEDDREYGAQVIQGFSLSPENTLRLAAFVHRWTAPDGKHSYAGRRQDVSSYALVVADEHRVGDWIFDVGLRHAHSYYHDFTDPAFDLGGQSIRARSVNNQWDDPVLSGSIGATRRITDRSSFYSHGGLGERRPAPGAVAPDGSSLADESRITADAGLLTYWGDNGGGMLKFGGFGLWRRDAIVRINKTGIDERGDEFYFSGNRDIRYRGMELELRTPAFWEESLSLSANLTWMQTQQREEGGYSRYREIPSLIAGGGVNLDVGAWDANLIAKHVDQYQNFRFSQDGEYHDLGDYLDVALTCGVRFGAERNIRLYAAIDNLLDEKYSTVVGWTDSGRRYRLGLQGEF